MRRFSPASTPPSLGGEAWDQVERAIRATLLDKRASANARFSQYRGDPLRFVEEGLLGYAWSKQREIYDAVIQHRHVAVKAAHDVSKALHVDEPVLTPDGWRAIGSLSVGDLVYAMDGTPTRVAGVFPQGMRQLYRVTLSDGASVLADADHLWLTKTRVERRRRRGWSTRTTAEIAATLTYRNGAADGLEHMIPTVEAIQAPDVDLPVEPHLLGQWLGNGTGGCGAITDTGDQFQELGAAGAVVRPPHAHRKGAARTATVAGLRKALRKAGVLEARSHERFIPGSYKQASPGQRLAVLQGLLDTDGSIGARNAAVSFTSSSERLADDVAELVRSLGGLVRRATHRSFLDGVEKRLSHRLTINLPPGFPPFRLPRKVARYQRAWDSGNGQRWRQRFIASVEPALIGPAVCITVEHPSRTYVTRDHIVTHNSYTAATLAGYWISCHDPGSAFVISLAPTAHQVRGILWREIGAIHRRGGLPGRTNQTEWLIGNQLVGYGRSPRDNAPTSVQGIHARYVLGVLDEADGIGEPLFDAIDTMTANEHSRVLAIGNPDNPSSHFATICKPGSGWHVITISAFDSPNLTGEEVPDWLRPLLVSKTWVEERKKRWGERSPRYISKVLGQFPENVRGALWTIETIEKCQHPADAPIPQMKRIAISIDPSGGDGTSDAGDPQGIIVAGLGVDGRGYILADGTVNMSPAGWGRQAIRLFDAYQADVIVAEINFGGAMVAATIRAVRKSVPIREVRASRGKMVRAEPVAALYEQGLIFHAPAKMTAKGKLVRDEEQDLGPLEAEMRQATATGYAGSNSPNRLDAMVWAITELMLMGDHVFTAPESGILIQPLKRIPSFWPKVCVLDIRPGRMAAIWATVDPETDVVTIYGEWTSASQPLPVLADALRRRGSVPIVIDPHAHGRSKSEGQSLIAQLLEFGLDLFTVEFDLEAGIGGMTERLETGRLKVYETCEAWVTGYRNFRRDEDGDPVEEDDHMMRVTCGLCSSAIQVAAAEPEPEQADFGGRSKSRTGY